MGFQAQALGALQEASEMYSSGCSRTPIWLPFTRSGLRLCRATCSWLVAFAATSWVSSRPSDDATPSLVSVEELRFETNDALRAWWRGRGLGQACIVFTVG